MSKVILIVDDEKDVRSIIKDMLQEGGFDVLEAESGAKALELVRTQHVDLIIIDLVMPEMNGIELSLKVKNLKPDLKTIGISATAFTLKDEMTLNPKEFFNEYIPKPFSIANLLKKVTQLIK